jgi:hypothetical protein
MFAHKLARRCEVVALSVNRNKAILLFKLMLARWANVKLLTILSDLDNMNNRLSTRFHWAIFAHKLDNRIGVSITQIGPMFVDGVALLQIFIDHQCIRVCQIILFQANQASVDNIGLLHNCG